MWKLRLDSCQLELPQTAGEAEAKSVTMYNNNTKNSMYNAMKDAI